MMRPSVIVDLVVALWRRTGAAGRRGTAAAAMLVMAALPAFVAEAAIVSGTVTTPTPATTASLTFSHAVTAGPNRALVVVTAHRDGNLNVTAITYGGVALTQAIQQNGNANNNEVNIWYLLNPTVGSANVVVTLSGSARVAAGAINLTGVHQTTPVGTAAGAAATSAAPSVTVGGAVNELVIGAVSANGDAVSVASAGGQSSIVNTGSGTAVGDIRLAAASKAGAASVTVSWTLGASKAWGAAAVPFKPAPTYQVSGTVFEDVNYGGGAGRSLAGSAGVGVNGATVELYNSAGSYVSNTTTAGGGAYSFTGLAAGAYHLRVVNSSVASQRTGTAGTLRGVMTYRTTATSGTAAAVTDHVGGTSPSLVDPGAGSSGTTFNTSTFVFSAGLSGTAQSVAPVTLSSANIASVDFGFNFDTVVNINDTGQGSLRQAITNANTLTGDASLAQSGRTGAIENLVFMLPNGTAAAGLRSTLTAFSGGVATIAPVTALPTLSTSMVIDAQTQPGWAANPVVQLNGNGMGIGVNCLSLSAGGSTLRGLVINRCRADALRVTGGSAHVFQGNWIGLNSAGTAASAFAGSSSSAIALSNTSGVQIGGTTAAQRNVLSGNTSSGVYINTNTTTLSVTGNYIGTNAAGAAIVANAVGGILWAPSVTGTSGITIGGTTAGQGNVISGNTGTGVSVTAGAPTIAGNIIGLNAAGTAALRNTVGGIQLLGNVNGATIGGASAAARNVISGNTGVGISAVSGTVTNVVIRGNGIGTNLAGTGTVANTTHGIDLAVGTAIAIGGTAVGSGNVIAGNGSRGVNVRNATTSGVSILGNSIYGNTSIGIDLANNGVSANDGAKTAGQPNLLMDQPVFTSATLVGSTLTVAGYVGSAAGQSVFAAARVEVFVSDNDASGYGEGRTYVGFLTTDASGNFSGNITVPGGVTITAGTTRLTGTATDGSNNTSEFGPNLLYGLGVSGTVFEDLNYGGGAGRSLATSGGSGITGATVELYNGSGVFVSSATTAVGGSYSFSSLAAGSYHVRVAGQTVASTRSGSTSALRGVLTYRTTATSGSAVAVTDFVGGTNPALADPGSGSSGSTFNTSSFVFSAGLSGTAHAVAPLTLGSVGITGVDFGFNFDTVANTNSSGQGSLRQAITNANTLGGDASLAQTGRTAAIENLVFMIGNGSSAPGLRSANNLFSAGVASITPGVQLGVTAPLVLDAQTQPGWASSPVVELVGTGAPAGSDGLRLSGGNSTVRGFIVNRYSGNGIRLQTSGGNTVQGCYIGTNAAGTAAAANGLSGLYVDGVGNNSIGGNTAAQRNVLSGNTGRGVWIDGAASSGNVVRGNAIGVAADGTTLRGNGQEGIYINAPGNAVGGTAAGSGNIVAGSAGGYDGIYIASGIGNSILGNSIYANGGLGIDLGVNGVTLNDGAKTGGQANLLMDQPVFTSARARGNQLTVAGFVGTAAGQSVFSGSRIEVFTSDADVSGYGEGRTYLGALTADASGNFGGTVTMPYSALRAGSVLTGTATDSSNNTSEFGVNFSGLIVDWVINHNGDGVDANPGDGLCETSTPGQCTLRAAIMETNAWAGSDFAAFELPSCPGAGCVITPATALPAITGQLTIDGQTQPGWTSAPLVDLRGESAGAGSSGLNVTGAGSAIRGLAVGGFLQSGIVINANNVTVQGVHAGVAPDGSTARANGAAGSATGGVYIASGTGIVIGGTTATTRNVLSGNGGSGVWVAAGTSTIIGNHIGTKAAGTAALGNGRWGVTLSAAAQTLGGSTTGQGNVISGNTANSTGGVLVLAAGQTIQGNTIGLNAARTAAIANGNGATTYASGIDLRTGNGQLVGGTGAGEGNVIAGNQGHGIRVAVQGARMLGNSLYNNLSLGIDLNADGVTPNNGTVSAGLANNDMDHPVITSAGYDPATRALTLTGYVGTGSGQALFAGARIELFSSDGDATGYGEGSAFVGTVTADANGRFSGTVSVPAGVSFAVGSALTGTATDTSNNTSEFGPNYVTTTMSALAPSRFNAFESGTLAGALTGMIQTRVAGAAGNIAVIAIDNSGTALQTVFAGTVTLEWMNAADNSGVLDAGNCRSSWVAAGSAGSTAFVIGDLGRRNASVTPSTVGREWRLRMSYAGPSGTVTSCSTDAFAVRPDVLAITGVTDADDSTAGTTRVLDNLLASGGRVHRAGRPFSLRAAARDAASAVASGYTGTPTLAITGCVLPAGCSAGTLSAPALVASAGLVAIDTLSYGEVGAINLQLTDDSFADIDAADTALAQRRIQSSVVGVGRFVPDRYLLSAATPPQFATQQGSCAATGQGFTYVGQNFGWASAPSLTVTAQNAAGATTALWAGSLQKLTTSHIARSLAASNAQGLTPSVTWGTMTLADAGSGVASVALSGDQFLFARNTGAPVQSFNPLITLGIAVSDVSELAVSGNSAVASASVLAIGSGTGIAFNQGSNFHYARLKLQNAFGDARRGVRANIELQKFSDRGWLRLSEDNTCITVPQASMAFSAGSGAFATDVCTAPASASVALRQGRGTLVLPKTVGNLQGAAMVTLNIGSTLEGNACAASVAVSPTSAAWPHLLGSRGSGTTQDQNPAARLVWGRQHRDYMVQRELF